MLKEGIGKDISHRHFRNLSSGDYVGWWSPDPKESSFPWRSPYVSMGGNPIKFVDPLGDFEWDKNGNLKAQKDDNAYTLAKMLDIEPIQAINILRKSGYSINDNGVLDLKIGDKIDKNKLSVDFKNKNEKVIKNTLAATIHYYFNNGEPADVGDLTTVELLNTSKFKEKHNRIVTGKSREENGPDADVGDFSVDMTTKTFHIGKTNVIYSVHHFEKYSMVNYQLFVNDGFWDVRYIREYTYGFIPYLDSMTKSIPDGDGPNLEYKNGKPFHYIPRYRNFYFKPQKVDNDK